MDNRGKASLTYLEDTNPPATPAIVEATTTRPPPGDHPDTLTHERDRLLSEVTECLAAYAL